MEKTKIYAGGIANLTDARYFAAWYVDWMGFDMEKCISGDISLNEIAAIKEWVDVDNFVLEYSGLEDCDLILEHSRLLEINTIKVGPFCPEQALKILNSKAIFKEVIFENSTPLATLSANINRDQEYVDHYIIKGESTCQTHYFENSFPENKFYFDLPNLASFIANGILNTTVCEGIVVKGGEEERVGVKSFEELDEVYELLID